ncbi:hypothetical protein F511_35694 [Dorcoceras hygrometricum]|uniref:Uncharacterized protein n=1 Tax=Dorcoceras hygrometricum TaxID=472368 RepID=A0A2Z7CFG2_9LAMI|nr:hypothetical protein F511_35694 [Dorcoceras hygrometricum]
MPRIGQPRGTDCCGSLYTLSFPVSDVSLGDEIWLIDVWKRSGVAVVSCISQIPADSSSTLFELLVTHAMSLFDLQDVCMVIGSLATLDLPMVADLIEIFVLKGPYCTLTMTDWFLQALSVIPRGSWGNVARRFTMIRWVSPKMWFRSHKCFEATVDPVATQRFPDAVFWSNQTQEDQSIVVEEDSGEASVKPDASNSSIQSRAYMYQLLLYIFSSEAWQTDARFSRSDDSAAKQLTTYEELSKLDRFALALKIQQEDFALIISTVEATVDPVATQRFPDAVFWSNQTQEDQSIVVEEDSGEASVKPDASNSSIQSRAYMYQLLLYIFSSEAWQTDARFSRSDDSVAKQLITYEEFTKDGCTSLKRNQQVATVLPGVSYNKPAVATHPVVGKSSRKLQCYCISSRLGTQTQEKKKQASVETQPVVSYRIQSQEKKM